MISKTIDIVVTSVLQTTAGKMIFGRYIEPGVAAQAAAPQTASSTAVSGPTPAPAPAPVKAAAQS